jgi:cell division GTPase FtsZ
VDLPIISMPWDKKGDQASSLGDTALNAALNDLSVQCNPARATKAMYLVSAPEKYIGMEMVTRMGEYIRKIAPDVALRYGDYPVDKALLDVTVVFSGLKEIDQLERYRETV